MTSMAQKSQATQMTIYVLEALGSLYTTYLCNLSLPPHPQPPLRPKNREDFTHKSARTYKTTRKHAETRRLKDCLHWPDDGVQCDEASPQMMQDYNTMRPASRISIIECMV